MRLKANLMDAAKMRRTVIHLAHVIAVDSTGFSRLVLIGIGGRGEALAKEISAIVQAEIGKKVPVGHIDVSDESGSLSATEVSGCFPSDAYVITVNDVLRSGRTAYAVSEAIAKSFATQRISHAVLVDCSKDSSLIKARFAGTKLDVDDSDIVSVSVKDVDGVRRVDVYSVDY